jgi:hypothetical protein
METTTLPMDYSLLDELELKPFPKESSSNKACILIDLRSPKLADALDNGSKRHFQNAVGAHLAGVSTRHRGEWWRRAVAWLHIYVEGSNDNFTTRLGLLKQLI